MTQNDVKNIPYSEYASLNLTCEEWVSSIIEKTLQKYMTQVPEVDTCIQE